MADRSRSTQWLLVETLRDGQTVVAEDTRPRAWVSPERAVSKLVGDRRVWPQLREAIERLPGSSDPVVESIRGGRYTHVVTLLPCVGPGGSVYGVWVHFGRAADQPPCPPPPLTLALEWRGETRFVSALGEASEILGVDVPDRPLTSPEVFELIRVDNDLELITEVLLKNSSGNWISPVELRHRPGVGASLVMAADREDPTVWRGLLYATPRQTTEMTSLDAAALSALPRLAPNRHLVLVDVQKVRLLQWITAPLEGVQWKGQVDDRDTPHPDDVERIFTVAAAALAGEIGEARIDGIRLRAIGGGWIVVDAAATLIAEESGPQLALIQFTVTGRSDDPDPVAVTDKGHPGLSMPSDK